MSTLATQRLGLYLRLTRLDKPIGILLLLWPTLWAVWIAGAGQPSLSLVLIFVMGTVLMRSAGCVINDYFDRDFDLHVERTQARVLTTGQMGGREALAVAGVLALAAAMLVIPLNRLTWGLAGVALFLAFTYPLMKRWFGVPQAYLGIAFGFGIPMAFAAQLDTVPMVAWLLLAANIAWTIAYDTEYAMVDREDDLKLGLRTSAITFGRHDVLAVGVCYAVALVLLGIVGWSLQYGWAYAAGVLVAGAIAVRHLYWIRHRERAACFRAFLNNTWFGFAVFAGIVLETGLFG